MFSYDRYGNMTCVLNGQTNGPCGQFTFNTASNHLTNSGYTYDSAGDVTGDGLHTYQWDAEGRLSSVDTGSTANYTYNALGQRVEKKVGTTYTELAYDGSGEPVGEHNRTSWAASYISFNGRHLANYQNSATYFSHGGALGTTGMVTDYAGNVAQDELHYPWGQQWSMAGNQQEERFARFRRRDDETAFDPTHFRMYTANQGRWPSPDPAGKSAASPSNPQSFNRYAYVRNNPGNGVDPSGLDEISNMLLLLGPWGASSPCTDTPIYGGNSESGQIYLGTACAFNSFSPIAPTNPPDRGRPPCSSLSLSNSGLFNDKNYCTSSQVQSFFNAQSKTPSTWSGAQAASAFAAAGLNPGLAVGILGAETSFGGGPTLNSQNVSNPFGATGATNFTASVNGAVQTISKLESHANSGTDPINALLGQNSLHQNYTTTDIKEWPNNIESWFRKLAKFLGRCY